MHSMIVHHLTSKTCASRLRQTLVGHVYDPRPLSTLWSREPTLASGTGHLESPDPGPGTCSQLISGQQRVFQLLNLFSRPTCSKYHTQTVLSPTCFYGLTIVKAPLRNFICLRRHISRPFHHHHHVVSSV